MAQRHAQIPCGNPPVSLELKTLLQAYRFKSSYSKQIALNTGWLCIFK